MTGRWDAIGLLETTGFTPAMVALDTMEKAAPIRVLQAEINDFLGIVIKIVGPIDAVRASLESGHAVAERMGGQPVSDLISGPHEDAAQLMEASAEYNPLIEQAVVHLPRDANDNSSAAHRSRSALSDAASKEPVMADSNEFALGFIETQGFTAVFEAIDTACKAANVEVLGKEKLGGGYVTVIIRGDVAAVNAAIESGQAKVEGLGKLIAAHVIARPSDAVLALLPQV